MIERDSKVADRFKVRCGQAGQARCQVCEWAPPTLLGKHAWKRLCAHHVVPLSHGGEDHADNLVLLCPNCHALAHGLLENLLLRALTPAELVDGLGHLRRDADAFRRWVEPFTLKDGREVAESRAWLRMRGVGRDLDERISQLRTRRKAF